MIGIMSEAESFLPFPVANAEQYYHSEPNPNFSLDDISCDDIFSDLSDRSDTGSTCSVCEDTLYKQNATGFDINMDTFSEIDDNSEDEEMDEMEEEFPESEAVSDKFYYPRFKDSTRIQPLCYATSLDFFEPFEHSRMQGYGTAMHE